jgi:type IV pilus assembly protein PilM
MAKKFKRYTCIDFGQSFIKIVYIESGDESFRVLAWDIKKIPPSQENREEALNFIRDFLKTHSISARETYLSISDMDSIFIKYLTLSLVPKEELEPAIKWQLKDSAPFSLDEALLDWQLLGEYTDTEGAKKQGLICMAVKRSLLDKYLSLANDSGLKPLIVSSAPFNYANILRLKKESNIIAILDMGYKDTTLSIYKSNKLLFLRNLGFSADKLTLALTGTLMSDSGKLELSYEQAEQVKDEFGVPGDETAILKENIKAIHIISLMRPFLEGLSREIKRSFDYFASSFKEALPGCIYLCGGGANLKNIDTYLAKELGIKVGGLTLPDCIEVETLGKEEFQARERQLLSSIGLALADAQNVNLLPHEIRVEKIQFIQKASLRMAALVLAAVFLFLLFVLKFQTHDYEKRLKICQAHLKALEEIRLIKDKISAREGLIDKIEKKRTHVPGLLKIVSNIMPGNMVLDEFDLDLERRVLILRGLTSAIDTVTQATLTDFMKRLEASSFIDEATLVECKASGEFEIRCNLVQN